MLPRTARRLESTLLLYSRQSLPRPARLHNSAPARSSAQASAAASSLQPGYHIPTRHASSQQEEDARPVSREMQNFLKRRTSYTLLPVPLPDDRASALNDLYFADSVTQDLVAVMDACLHNLSYVSRAKGIFDRLRREKKGDPILEPRLYNTFIQAYVEMATTKGKDDYVLWVEEAWELYARMESGVEGISPTPATYAIMLIALHRFSPDSSTPLPNTPKHTATTILTGILNRGFPLTDVVSDRVFTSSSEAAAIIQVLSQSAVDLGKTEAVHELGRATALGTTAYDPLQGVPEANPVLVPTKKDGETSSPDSPEFEPPFNLRNLRKHLGLVRLARRALPEDVAARQKLLEESVWDVAEARMKQQNETMKQLGMDNAGALKSSTLQAWMWGWHLKLTERLESEIKAIIKVEQDGKRKTHGATMGPFLTLLKPDRLSIITILEVMRLHGSGGVSDGMKTARALLQVGKSVEGAYRAEMCRKNNIHVPNFNHGSSAASTPTGSDHGWFSLFGYHHLHARRVTARKYMEDSEEWTSTWTQSVRVKVGSILVDSLMNVATVERTGLDKRTGVQVKEEQPAFYHGYEYIRGQKLGVIRLNPVVVERLSKDSFRDAMHPRHLPMLVPPKPWLDYDRGGYLFNSTYVMRFKDSQEQMSYLKHASNSGHVELVFAGLDVLGSTPWKINRQVFDIVLQVWNSGERLCKIPPQTYDAPEPEKPANELERDIKAKSVYLQRLKAWNQNRANNHSDRCSVNYKVEIARAFLGDTLYLPHNLDFRGRAYPIPPHLNHMGDDLSRGLLMFGEAKPLGERGLRWLKIHLANLYGFDKGNFDERVNFVIEHLDDIYDSAEKPLEGRRWWTTADDPWQFLAGCIELKAALEHPVPTEYESSLPVHQDGTCNGLQHYAALGGDDEGARQVNLSATDRPSDVYTHVADMVNKIMEEDIKNGHKVATSLQGKVSRKVVKQTVMTTVYGVTFVGAREQIAKQLRDRKDIPEEECWGASTYLAKQVLACIGNLFRGARGIQIWLNLCARLISKSIPEERLPEVIAEQRKAKKSERAVSLPVTRLKKEQMTSVVWTTPLGLPIVQPYRKVKRKQVRTALQSVYISDPNSLAEVNPAKQASAFPPNFIHSLDATHMMLTALECRTRGLTFASVHDSYWTHACSIDKMSEIIRESFINLHSSNVLVKLLDEFKERYKNHKVAVASIAGGKLPSSLRTAGTTLHTSPENAEKLAGLEALFVMNSDDHGMKKAAATVDSTVMGKKVKYGSIRPFDGLERVPLEIDMEDAEESDEDDTDLGPALRDKFVDLADLIPPLPEKGDFDVGTIKKSQYFFS